MNKGRFQFRSSTIAYRYGGRGDLPLICFHGYGETANKFDFLEPLCGDRFTIIAPDLPFHGDTIWNGQKVEPQDIVSIIELLLKQVNIRSANIHLLGYSLGGRISLCLLQQMTHKITKLVLLAPDGLKLNFWYWLATQNAIGNRLFRFTMKKPQWFFGFLKAGNKLGIINQSIFKFVDYYIHDNTVRKALYERWTGLSRCTPDLARIREEIRNNNIAVRLLYGKYDRIILPSRGEKFSSGLPDANLEMIDCGHQVLHERNASAIRNALIH